MEDGVETCKSIGNKLFKERDFSAALKYYKQGLKLVSNHPQLNCNASTAAFNLGLFDEAERFAVRAFTSKKDYEKAYVRAVKAAEKKNDLEKQLDYILKGMENCDTCDALLEEAERIQHCVVLSSFCQYSEVEDFFSQPRANQKFIALEQMMNKVKARKAQSPRISVSKPKNESAQAKKGKVGIPLSMNDEAVHQKFAQLANSGVGGFTIDINEIPSSATNKNDLGAFVEISAMNKKAQNIFAKPSGSTVSPAPPASPAQCTKPFAQTVYPKKVETTAKENVSLNTAERGRTGAQTPNTMPPPSLVPDNSKKNTQAPREKSNQRTGKRPRNDSFGSNDRDSSKQTQEQPVSITQEILLLLKNGREAFKNSFFPVAATFLMKAQSQLKEHSLEDDQEFALCKVPLSYVICEAKVCCGEYKDLEEGIQLLKKLIEDEGLRKFPAALYLLGLAYFKLNRFKEARAHLNEVNVLIKGNVNFITYPWPGTFDVIDATQKAYLETVVNDLLRQCRIYHKPNWICLFDECEKISAHIIPSRKIYFNDPDFSGYVELSCSSKCALIFHRHCWKTYKEQQQSIRRLTDKAILGQSCLTPDCEEAVIVGIAIYDKDGKVMHRDSIPFEPPAKKQAVERAKSTESSTVPKSTAVQKETTVPKAVSSKKQKTVSVASPVPGQKPTRPVQRATDEVPDDTDYLEEKDIDFEAELNSRKIKLDNIRNTNKRWQHFTIDAPIPSQFELAEEEKFVESFFEEVLKETGPIHISRVEDFFKENKALLEEAVPALRCFYNLLQFLLNRSHRFVLMDSIFGLATDVIPMYQMTKENINTRIKIPSAKASQDLPQVIQPPLPVRPAVPARPALPAGCDDSVILIPYKKNGLDTEPVGRQSNTSGGTGKERKLVLEDSKLKSAPIELNYKQSSKTPLQLGLFLKKPVAVIEKQNSGTADPLRKPSSTPLETRELPRSDKGKRKIEKKAEEDSSTVKKLSEIFLSTVKKVGEDSSKETSVLAPSNNSEPLFIREEQKCTSLSGKNPKGQNLQDFKDAPSMPFLTENHHSLTGTNEETVSPLKECVKTFIQKFVQNTQPPDEDKQKSLSNGNFIHGDASGSQSSRMSSISDSCDTDYSSADSFRSIPNSAHTSDTEARSVGSHRSAAAPILVNDRHPNHVPNGHSNSDSSPERCGSSAKKPFLENPCISEAKSAGNKKPVSESDSSNSEASAVYSIENFVSDNVDSPAETSFQKSHSVGKMSSANTCSPSLYNSLGKSANSMDLEVSKTSEETSQTVSGVDGIERDTVKEEINKSQPDDIVSEFRFHKIASFRDFITAKKIKGPNKKPLLVCAPEKQIKVAPSTNLPEELHLDIPCLPIVSFESDSSSSAPKPPSSPVFDVEAKLSEPPPPSETTTLKKDLLSDDLVLFQECREDLFIIDDKDLPLSDTPALDLPPLESLVWDLKDLPENGDLFAINTGPVKDIPIEDDLFQVHAPDFKSTGCPTQLTKHEYSSGFGSFETNRENSQGRNSASSLPVGPADSEGALKTEENKFNNRWKPRQEHMDFIRLSFPRENYSRLIEGLGILYDRKGPEIDKMDMEDIVKDLAEIFQLPPCPQHSSNGGDSPENVLQQTQSSDIFNEDESVCEKSPWRPPVPLVQVVRLSFPTEEFYKLMFALYLAKIYSDTTRFEDLCDSVATVLNDINEGRCQDYNYEISTHGPYNEESRIIYGNAWRMILDNSRPESQVV